MVVLFIAAHAIAFPFASNYIIGKVSENVSSKVLEIEYAKVGGKENYDLINQANVLQIKDNIPKIKEYLESNKKATTTTQQPNGETVVTSSGTATSTTLTQESVASLLKDSYAIGKSTARYLLVEYSDLECPFCVRQHKDGVIEKIAAKYKDDVRHVFKPFRAVPHEGAEPKAIASLCVGKLGGADKYAKFYKAIFEGSDMQGKVYPVSDLAKLAKEVGVNQDKFNACYKSKDTVNLYDAYTAEGKSYGAQGTPGTLIVDTKTGKYTLIAGAYPFESFVQAIEAFNK